MYVKLSNLACYVGDCVVYKIQFAKQGTNYIDKLHTDFEVLNIFQPFALSLLTETETLSTVDLK